MKVWAQVQADLRVWKRGRIYAPSGEKREEKRLTADPFLFIKSILQNYSPFSFS
jgi:hypothetical protein